MPLRVAYGVAELEGASPRSSAVTLGVFDGVHRGHRRIIQELVDSRARHDIEQVWLITFDPHPVVVTHSREAPAILSTIDERLDLLANFPLDGVLVVRFDQATAQLDYRDFIRRYLLDGLDMRRFVVGYDLHFGHRRQGSPERVAEEGRRLGFDVHVVPPVEFDGEVVSSTNIRRRLSEGDLAAANRLLGHPYSIAGTVGTGQGMGGDLGFPTANLVVDDPSKLWPPRGVYAVRVRWRDRLYNGMMNVGSAPTIKGGKTEMEVHLFDFGNTIYGETVTVYCESWLRAEQKFPTLDALIEQLSRDRDAAHDALEGVRDARGPTDP